MPQMFENRSLCTTPSKTSAIVIYQQSGGEFALHKFHLSHLPDLRLVFTRKRYIPRSIHYLLPGLATILMMLMHLPSNPYSSWASSRGT
ncbi:uncharacterized protein Bfra_001800 [Botrytis fragariae]|uniref:Uncharacterized protein n=1 Tax=Botrytis fragariae TaxID=1964551 RepID=A0A8H6B0Y5_9HELO|nr:uncharacterized protein Bfra_001800 [Botrytis fragariae]KAF5877433.1 hypothetical protein Bfra_001800 [Botrytis fragariae]